MQVQRLVKLLISLTETQTDKCSLSPCMCDLTKFCQFYYSVWNASAWLKILAFENYNLGLLNPSIKECSESKSHISEHVQLLNLCNRVRNQFNCGQKYLNWINFLICKFTGCLEKQNIFQNMLSYWSTTCYWKWARSFYFLDFKG